MLTMVRARARSERGFTLIELLVVILIIGILAAMAIPTFLAQRSKAQDASAKSDARNMLSQVESCFTTEQDYSKCDTDTELSSAGAQPTGLKFGTAAGQVEVSGATAAVYTVKAHSKASGHDFTIVKLANGLISRSCTPPSRGACPVGGSW